MEGEQLNAEVAGPEPGLLAVLPASLGRTEGWAEGGGSEDGPGSCSCFGAVSTGPPAVLLTGPPQTPQLPPRELESKALHSERNECVRSRASEGLCALGQRGGGGLHPPGCFRPKDVWD